MRFTNICLEGPDCSGKTTLFNNIHKETNFKYNIQDRSCLSMYVFACMYKREKSFWLDKLFKDLKKLDTLYVVMLPPLEEVIKRIKKRGDNIHDENSIVGVWNSFNEIVTSLFGKDFPNVMILKSIDKIVSVRKVLNKLDILNSAKGSNLIKSFVVESKVNEIINISCISGVLKNELDYSVLSFKEEKEYYKKVKSKLFDKIKKEMNPTITTNINYRSCRRFIYTDDSCISMIHILIRENKIDFNVVMRSSNVLKTLWADYEFLKILAYESAVLLEFKYIPVKMNLNIRSAHLIP